MRNARVFGIAGLAAVALAAVAVAQTTEPAQPAAAPAAAEAPAGAPAGNTAIFDELAKTHWGDPAAGATKAGACAACHGLDGNSNANPALYPRIAGQNEMYVARQLALFKAGQRHTGNAALMLPFAMPLTAQDMRDLGAHYAAQASGAGIAADTVINDKASPYNGMKFYEPGQQLYAEGDAARGIPACTACHGPAGSGNPGPGYPHVGGQQDWYVARRLQEYRANQPEAKDAKAIKQFEIMSGVAKNLTDLEIASLGSYMQGLHNRFDQPSADALAKLPAGALQAVAAAPRSNASALMPNLATSPAPAPAAKPAPAAAPAPATQAPAAPADGGSRPLGGN